MYNPTICMIEADGQKFKVIFDPLWLPNNFEANLDNLRPFLEGKKKIQLLKLFDPLIPPIHLA